MIVYVMVIDYYEDDYKRAEGHSEILGVTDDKLEAYKKVLSMEYERNENGDKEYEKLYEKIESITLKNVDEFYEEWRDCRDEALGDPEFGGLRSTGHRAYVKECELINCS